ncbi:phosphopantothenoylcysteine decarboxylase [Pseudolactococcus paracarnosus]|uniref:Phosphopantothenoylcysteine decarboxylase n=1 Tax=Pseudolactococcus paracarnosus TaxID=2749962 RepID=A0A7L4WF53_9LACT|nr:phosphopantothenoylcysteine decarboxylase [Lactococcus paracarnosus]SPC38195.1 putative phosphopantothenoylcysteine decarboxylase [Lactococcus piscium]MCJ1977649.1 phosphopantothenoylcysteine decarboxylase [Lactococcus paracarnosus]MCJ1983792.1 phosphopantothenoylcysteine decarboxylase [Lactococcus paracarnosus]MCJ1993833.1 phosphopantothenoylcysteine decarboxylase [Lactococcus paracarnosus]MCJ1997314.1 phosphopantothenoylcysteine decarboxylase [Lactococcus paracarnosus]
MTTITIAVTGSISAYKAADIISELGKLGHDVTVLMTEAAQQFITPLTLQVLSKNPVHTSVMAEDRPEVVNHIDLAKQTELFLVAPATADTIARLAQGRANDIISAVALALPSSVKKMIAPAMNTMMYDNLLTQANIKTLEKVGFKEIEPRVALLACGDLGKGALATVDDIISAVQANLLD